MNGGCNPGSVPAHRAAQRDTANRRVCGGVKLVRTERWELPSPRRAGSDHLSQADWYRRVLNIQAWSKRPGYELSLAGDILSAMGVAPSSSSRLPQATFSGVARGGHIEVDHSQAGSGNRRSGPRTADKPECSCPMNSRCGCVLQFRYLEHIAHSGAARFPVTMSSMRCGCPTVRGPSFPDAMWGGQPA